jgi:hypothetical protein
MVAATNTKHYALLLIHTLNGFIPNLIDKFYFEKNMHIIARSSLTLAV